MKRGLTALVTFALVGGLMFMGFAGTAAAQDGLVDIGADVTNDQEADSAVVIDNEQSNTNVQSQEATSYSSSDKSYAETTAVQSQDVTQANSNSVSDVTAVSSNDAETDADTGIDVEIDADLDLGPPFGEGPNGDGE